MNSKEINHAAGLMKALHRRVGLLRDQAADLDSAKEGRSALAKTLRNQADAAENAAHDLKAALDAALWLKD